MYLPASLTLHSLTPSYPTPPAAANPLQPCPQVQWFEPRASLPPAVAAGMHEQEVVESDLIDTNLVGCLDSKATIIQASSYEEVGVLPVLCTACGCAASAVYFPWLYCLCCALPMESSTALRRRLHVLLMLLFWEQRLHNPAEYSTHVRILWALLVLSANCSSVLPLALLLLLAQAYHLLPEGHTGQWHFCRGTWDTERQVFRSYLEMGECSALYSAGRCSTSCAAVHRALQYVVTCNGLDNAAYCGVVLCLNPQVIVQRTVPDIWCSLQQA